MNLNYKKLFVSVFVFQVSVWAVQAQKPNAAESFSVSICVDDSCGKQTLKPRANYDSDIHN